MISVRIEVIAARGYGKTTVLNICIRALKEAGFEVSPVMYREGTEMVLTRRESIPVEMLGKKQ